MMADTKKGLPSFGVSKNLFFDTLKRSEASATLRF